MDLGARIAAWRRARGMSPGDFASRVGVTKQAVSLWEKNQSGVAYETLERIVDALGVSMRRFYGRIPKGKVVV